MRVGWRGDDNLRQGIDTMNTLELLCFWGHIAAEILLCVAIVAAGERSLKNET